MKLASLLAILGLNFVLAMPAIAQDTTSPAWRDVPRSTPDVEVSPNGDRPIEPPRTPREKNLGLEGKPPGQVEQPAPDDDMLSDVPDENLDDERLPPTPPVRPGQP